MITLYDLLTDMTYGEFAQLDMGNFIQAEHESEPDPKSYRQLTSHINVALHGLYSEFFLAAEEIYIQQYEQIVSYILSSEYAVSNTESTQPIKWIDDSAENPFKDNILKIEEVYDELGNRLPLNDLNNPDSLFTPTFRTLQIPAPANTNITAVQYRATHPRISLTSSTDTRLIEIVIPPQLQEPLMFHIASRVFSSLRNEDGAEGNDYYRKYQARLSDIRHQGLYVQPEATNRKFSDGGFI